MNTCYFVVYTIRGIFCIAAINKQEFLLATNNGRNSGTLKCGREMKTFLWWKEVSREYILSHISPDFKHYVGMAEANLAPAPYAIGFEEKKVFKTSTTPRTNVFWIGEMDLIPHRLHKRPKLNPQVLA